jgi:Ion channel
MPIIEIPPFGESWLRVLVGLVRNLGVARDMFIALGIWWLLSSILLFLVEDHGFWHSLYTTWTTMTTIGPLDGPPISKAGKVLISIDAFAGLILFGCVVWVVTTSLSRRMP